MANKPVELVQQGAYAMSCPIPCSWLPLVSVAFSQRQRCMGSECGVPGALGLWEAVNPSREFYGPYKKVQLKVGFTVRFGGLGSKGYV